MTYLEMNTKMMSKATRFTLFPDERVIVSTRIHWINLIVPGVLLIAGFSALLLKIMHSDVSLINLVAKQALIQQEWQKWTSLLGYILLVLFLLKQMLVLADLLLTRYYVTNKRVISISGVFNISMSEMLLDRCETVSLSQNFLERIFNIGDIVVLSAGSSMVLNDVPSVNDFRMKLLEMSSRTTSHPEDRE